MEPECMALTFYVVGHSDRYIGVVSAVHQRPALAAPVLVRGAESSLTPISLVALGPGRPWRARVSVHNPPPHRVICGGTEVAKDIKDYYVSVCACVHVCTCVCVCVCVYTHLSCTPVAELVASFCCSLCVRHKTPGPWSHRGVPQVPEGRAVPGLP